MSNDTPASGLHRRQAWTVALLFAGYAAYYFCRSDLSVAMPLLIEDSPPWEFLPTQSGN